jgi:hypothetical protein
MPDTKKKSSPRNIPSETQKGKTPERGHERAPDDPGRGHGDILEEELPRRDQNRSTDPPAE